jgi:hypothetical protein
MKNYSKCECFHEKIANTSSGGGSHLKVTPSAGAIREEEDVMAPCNTFSRDIHGLHLLFLA